MPVMSNGFIYALCHPVTLETRYIGLTIRSLEDRLKSHIYHAKRGDTNMPVFNWIRKLARCGARPIIVPLQTDFSAESIQSAEIAWIALARTRGVRVLNIRNGGAGGPLPQSVKDKIAAAKLGRKATDEAKANMRRARSCPIYKAKMSAARSGKKMSPESRAKLSAARTGVRMAPISEAHKLAISKANSGRKHPWLAELNRSRAGKPLTPEHRAKVVAALHPKADHG